MEYLAKDTISLLYFLLPGFVAAWVFFGLTAHPRREPFDRVIQALIFTFIIKAMGIGVRKVWWMELHPTHPFGIWDDEKEVVSSILLAFLVGLLFAVCANWDLVHRLLRKIKVTKRTSYPSEWYSGFHRFRRDVILHLKGERRIMGWADEWPDHCDRGHFLIQNPQWLDDVGTPIPLAQVKRTMIPAQDIEMVEFIFQPDELNEDVEVIKQAQEPLAKMHRRKETSDGQETRPFIQAAAEQSADPRADANVPKRPTPQNSIGEQSADSRRGASLEDESIR